MPPSLRRRVGFGQEKEAITHIIPKDVTGLLQQYVVSEEAQMTPAWDFVWNAIVEEGREKRLLSQCFTVEMGGTPDQYCVEADDGVLAEAALKVRVPWCSHAYVRLMLVR